MHKYLDLLHPRTTPFRCDNKVTFCRKTFGGVKYPNMHALCISLTVNRMFHGMRYILSGQGIVLSPYNLNSTPWPEVEKAISEPEFF